MVAYRASKSTTTLSVFGLSFGCIASGVHYLQYDIIGENASSIAAVDSKLERLAKEVNAVISGSETKGLWLPEKFEDRPLHWIREGFRYTIAIYPAF